jgi:hypothetical protein
MATKNKEYVLVKLESNYADEFDVEAFVVVSTEYFENAKARIRALDSESKSGLYMNFGTNEALEWGDFDDFEDSLEITPLNSEQVACFEQLFPPTGHPNDDVVAAFGHSLFLSNIGTGSPY